MTNQPVAVAFLLTIFASFACGPPGNGLDGDPLGTPGAHEHGTARVSLAVDGTEVTAELSVPGMAAFGFEHAARSEEDLAAIERTTGAVESRFTELIALDQELGCRLDDVDTGVTGESDEPAGTTGGAHDDHPDPGHEHTAEERHPHADHHGSDEGDSEHSELTVHAVFHCQHNPTDSEVGLGISALFPEIERVDLQILSNERQAGARVASNKRFRL